MDTILAALAVTWEPMIFLGLPILILIAMMIFIVTLYRRCPSNKVLVVYGGLGGQQTARCIHGGGAMVWPVVQHHDYLSLEPILIDVELRQALTLQNDRVNVFSTFTVGISTQPDILQRAAERLLGLFESDVSSIASEIILSQLRLVIATLSVDEIHQEHAKFLELITKNVGYELNKIGLSVINVNIRDMTYEVGARASLIPNQYEGRER